MVSVSGDTRKLIRAVIKKIHPDLFQSNNYERQINAESLKILNGYVDQLSKGHSPRTARVEFFLKEADGAGGSVALKKVVTQLTGEVESPAPCSTRHIPDLAAGRHAGSGSLAPLFFSFGLIDAQQLQQEEALGGGSSDTNFLSYLREQVSEAVRTAEHHDTLKWSIRKLRAGLEERHSLSSVQVSMFP